MDYRVPNLVKLALAVDTRLGTETLSMGTTLLYPEASCSAEIYGRYFFYLVALVEEKIELRVCSMDGPGEGEMERILSMDSDDKGFETMFRVIRALEWSGLSSLEPKPISIGPPAGGPDSFVIA
jgi:hypothetical protein